MNYTSQLDAVERLIGSGNLKGALAAILPILREVTSGGRNQLQMSGSPGHAATQFFVPPGMITLDTSGVVFHGDFKVTGDIVAGGDVLATMSSTDVFTETKVTTEDGTVSYTYSAPGDDLSSPIGLDPEAEIESILNAEIHVEVTRTVAEEPNRRLSDEYTSEVSQPLEAIENTEEDAAEIEAGLKASLEDLMSGTDTIGAGSAVEALPESAEAPAVSDGGTETVEGSEGAAAPATKRRGGRPPKAANPA